VPVASFEPAISPASFSSSSDISRAAKKGSVGVGSFGHLHVSVLSEDRRAYPIIMAMTMTN